MEAKKMTRSDKSRSFELEMAGMARLMGLSFDAFSPTPSKDLLVVHPTATEAGESALGGSSKVKFTFISYLLHCQWTTAPNYFRPDAHSVPRRVNIATIDPSPPHPLGRSFLQVISKGEAAKQKTRHSVPFAGCRRIQQPALCRCLLSAAI